MNNISTSLSPSIARCSTELRSRRAFRRFGTACHAVLGLGLSPACITGRKKNHFNCLKYLLSGEFRNCSSRSAPRGSPVTHKNKVREAPQCPKAPPSFDING